MENEKIQDVETTEEQQVQTENKEESKKKKKNIFKIIFNIFITILFIVILLNAIIGIINMQQINNDEKPIWYLRMETTETDLKTVTEYDLGLYKIVKTDTARETKTKLIPFFLES